MSPPGPVQLATLFEPFSAVFPDGLEHGEARLGVSGSRLAQQAFVNQRGYGIEQIDPQILVCVADGLGGFERAAAPKEPRPPAVAERT